MEKITHFDGQYRFLSNFYPAPVVMEALTFPSVEHAYQAAKFPMGTWGPFLTGSPGQAKRLGRRPGIRDDWEDVKVAMMEALVSQKFNSHPTLRLMLLGTGSAHLEEGNTWGDKFWGTCNGVGQNHLGQILMRVRASL